MPRKYPINKPIRYSLIGLFILFFLYSLTQFLPVFIELLEANSLYSAIGALGVGVCLFIYSVTNSYYVWTLDKVSFLEWDRDQQFILSNKEISADAFDIRWPTRVLNLFLALLGLVVMVAAVYWVFNVFPK